MSSWTTLAGYLVAALVWLALVVWVVRSGRSHS